MGTAMDGESSASGRRTERRTALFWSCDRPIDQIAPEIVASAAGRGRAARPDDDRLVLSGPERYTLAWEACRDGSVVVRLDEEESAYSLQCENAHHATNLLRMVVDVAAASLARFCVFPTPDSFVPDPAWNAVADAAAAGATFVLMPTGRVPAALPFGFRTCQLANGLTTLMSLPMKRYPAEEPPTLSEIRRAEKVASMEAWKRVAEDHYAEMSDARSRGDLSFHRETALDALGDAWKIAMELGLEDEAARIRDRQLHVRAVARQLGN